MSSGSGQMQKCRGKAPLPKSKGDLMKFRPYSPGSGLGREQEGKESRSKNGWQTVFLVKRQKAQTRED